jgi:undecaprenyl diphosphate synthase
MTVGMDLAARQEHGGAATVPRHVAIIMDGNGRWAAARGLGRTEGHRRGVQTVRDIVRHAGQRGVDYLTLFSFSSENWRRPAEEVNDLLMLMRLFIRRDLGELHRAGVRVRIIGERGNLPADILELIDEAEGLTARNKRLTLVVAFNYGARNELVRAARRIAEDVKAGRLDPAAVDDQAIASRLDTADIPDPELIIRTSGEQRLSNFLLWQVAYSEFVFSPTLWPDFAAADFDEALKVFQSRERRFGGVPAAGA